MLPRSLTVQNFLSYGAEPQTLSFVDFDMAVLIGANGVGKSSLIEALTWGLWGEARTGSDNDLVHQGATAMSVTVDVDVRGDLYRVLRKRSIRGKGGTSTLEFQVFDGEAFRALTTPTIRETQARINETLGLTYDTFVNSAYLRQGRADEFTTKRPADRKALLGEILGLGTYDALEKRVRAELAARDTQLEAQRFFLEQVRTELEQLPVLEATLAERERALSNARATLTLAEQELETWRARAQELATTQERVQASAAELDTLAHDISILEQEIARVKAQQAEVDALLAARAQIERDAAEATKAASALEHWNEKLQRVHELQQERFEQERVRNALRAQHDAALQKLDAEISVLEGSIQQMRALADPAARDTARTTLEQLRSDQRATEAQLATARAELASAISTAASAEARGTEVKARAAQLTKAGASCPLCTQSLSVAHRKTVMAEYDKALDEARSAYKHAQEQQRTLQKTITALEGRVRAIEPEIQRAENALASLEAAAAQDAQRVQMERALEVQRAARDAHVNAPVPPELTELDRALKTMERKLAMLSYDAAAHATVREDAERLAPALERATTLATAEDRSAALAQQRASLQERAALKHERRTVLETERTTLVRALEGATLLEAGIVEKTAARDAAAEEARRAERSAAEQRATVAALRAKADAQARVEAERATITDELSLLDELRQAFGRNGIPAMLIEAAIPEIEERANDMLGRMTDHQLALRLDVTREKRSGAGTVETLDIRIADLQGTRDYELFSGGEAFRINFALRVALSRLLARKAGTELRLLVIDEGFGSQDTAGRETLVTVLNAIRGDFEKILVVTHIQELKDAFSYQLRVEKRPEGSVLIRE